MLSEGKIKTDEALGATGQEGFTGVFDEGLLIVVDPKLLQSNETLILLALTLLHEYIHVEHIESGKAISRSEAERMAYGYEIEWLEKLLKIAEPEGTKVKVGELLEKSKRRLADWRIMKHD